MSNILEFTQRRPTFARNTYTENTPVITGISNSDVQIYAKKVTEKLRDMWNNNPTRKSLLPNLTFSNNEIPFPDINPNTREIALAYSITGDASSAAGIFENQISESVNIIHKLIHGTKHIAFLAETQFGKTATLCLSIIMFNAWQHKNKSKAFIRVINPNRISANEQTVKDFERILEAMRPLEINDVLIKESNGKYHGIPARMLTKSNTRTNNAEIQNLAKLVSGNELDGIRNLGYDSIILFVDEADEALGGDSFMDKSLNSLKQFGVDFRLVMISATCWEYKNLRAFDVIEATIGKDYSGFVRNPVDQHSFTTIAELLNIPELAGYSTTNKYEDPSIVANMLLGFHQGVAPTAMCNIRVYDPLHSSKKDKFFESRVSAATIGFNGLPWNGGRGAMLRYGKSREQLNFLFEMQIELAELGIHLLRFESGSDTTVIINKKQKTIAGCKTVIELIDKATNLGVKNYVVCVVSRARRADRFPADCTIFMDMSEKPTYMTAIEQGTLGRASGWGKRTATRRPIVVMSEAVTDVVTEVRALYKKHGVKIPVIKPSQYAHNWARKTAYKGTLSIDFEGEMFRNYSNGLQDRLRQVGDIVLSNVKFQNRTNKSEHLSPVHINRKNDEECPDGVIVRKFNKADGGNRSWTLYNVFGILTRDDVAEIEDVATSYYNASQRVDLLLPGKTRADGKHYSSCENNEHIHVALRSVDGKSDDGTGRSGRMRSDPTVKTNGWERDLVDMNVLITKPRDKPAKVAGLVMVLQVDLRDERANKGGSLNQTHPNLGTTCANHCADIDELEDIENHKKKPRRR